MTEIPAPGPELARSPGVALARPSPARLSQRSSQRAMAIPVAYYTTVIAVLAAAGYPAWRVAAVALGFAAHQTYIHVYFGQNVHRYAASCLKEDSPPAWRVIRKQIPGFVTTLFTVAITGGIRSPLLVTLLTPYFASLSVLGDRRETRVVLAATALDVWLLALLPRSWTGPELSSPVHTGLVVLSILGLVALLAPVHAALRIRSEALARARDEMASEALARARSLEQVGSKVAHELKNPLTAVKALVQLGVRNTADGSLQHELLQVVEKEVARMQDILQGYLSFTQPLQEVRTQRTELGTVVADTLAVLSARADHAGVQLSSQGDASVEADPRRLKEALLNLVANAIEATPRGGEVAVEVRSSDGRAEIIVRDTGRGMPPETLRRLGTPFFTTRDDGTGLGVVLARSVFAQHGGSLHYESEIGKGTSVTAILPARPAPRHGDGARAAGG